MRCPHRCGTCARPPRQHRRRVRTVASAPTPPRNPAARPPSPAPGCPRRYPRPNNRDSAQVAQAGPYPPVTTTATAQRSDRLSIVTVQHRHLGRSGLRVPGCAGHHDWAKTPTPTRRPGSSPLHRGGGTLVDTADVYTDAEHILGGLIGDVIDRDDIIIATKAVARRDDGPFGGGASRGALLTALNGSLRRLASTTSTSGSCTPGQTVPSRKPQRHRRRRTPERSATPECQLHGLATGHRGHHKPIPTVSTQVEYSLLERGIEREVVPAATTTASASSAGPHSAAASSPAKPQRHTRRLRGLPPLRPLRRTPPQRTRRRIVQASSPPPTDSAPHAGSRPRLGPRPPRRPAAVVGARDTTQLQTSLAPKTSPSHRPFAPHWTT